MKIMAQLVMWSSISFSAALVGATATPPIGLFTAVQGQVGVTHADAGRIDTVKLHDQVHFRDLIETREAARMRALLDDDTVLTLAENSRLDITEHVYVPTENRRTAVLRLLKGTVRSLVGRAFGAGSKFEIHTPTAIVAARGTYFVVWQTEQGETGIANIGQKGDVEFTAGERSVIVRPGLYSLAAKGEGPSRPAPIAESAAARQAVRDTEMKDSSGHESPKTALQALGTNPASDSQLILSDGTSINSVTRLLGTDTLLATPPAVVSGAVDSTNSTLTSSLSPVTSELGSVLNPITGSTSTLTTTTTTLTGSVTEVLGQTTTTLLNDTSNLLK